MNANPEPVDIPQRSRDLVRNLLLQPKIEQAEPYGLLWHASDIAKNAGWRFDWEAAIEYWWDLARAGLIALVGGSHQGYGGMRTFILTERGRIALNDDRASPYEHERYLKAVREGVRELDPIVLAYLEESIGALRARLHRARIIMLGAASERLIILLSEAVRDASLVPYSEKLKKWLAADKPIGIAELFEYTRQALVEAAELPGNLSDEIDLNLTPIFERARGLRNQHGHPTGASVTIQQAEAGLLLFPSFCSLVDRVLTELESRRK